MALLHIVKSTHTIEHSIEIQHSIQKKLDKEAYEFAYKLASRDYEIEAYNEAISYYLEASQSIPEKPEPYHMIALCYQKQEKYSDALKYYNKALKADAEYEPSHTHLTALYQKLGNIQQTSELSENTN